MRRSGNRRWQCARALIPCSLFPVRWSGIRGAANAGRSFVVLAVSGLLAGCGLGIFDDPSGGFTDLPTEGAGPYGKPEFDFDTPADEPFVIIDNAGNLRDPTVLRRDDGGFRLWFSRSADQIDDASEIWTAGIADVLELPDQPLGPAMAATEPWEEGWVAAPSVVEMPDGRLVMYYEGGITQRSIGRATSDDGGASWQKSTGTVIDDAADPSAALTEGNQLVLYFTRPGTDGIFRAVVDPTGNTVEVDDQPVLTARTGSREAFDRAGVGEPYVVVERTASGRLHYGLFYSGSDGDDDVAIGYAGSFDGVDWQRFNGDEPILTAGNPTEHGPAAALEAARGFLFYDQRGSGRQRIGVALHP